MYFTSSECILHGLHVFYVVWMYVEFVPNTGTYDYTRKQIFYLHRFHNLVFN